MESSGEYTVRLQNRFQNTYHLSLESCKDYFLAPSYTHHKPGTQLMLCDGETWVECTVVKHVEDGKSRMRKKVDGVSKGGRREGLTRSEKQSESYGRR